MNHVLDTLILHAFENGSLTWYARYPLSPSLESKPSYSSAAAVVSLICVSHSLFLLWNILIVINVLQSGLQCITTSSSWDSTSLSVNVSILSKYSFHILLKSHIFLLNSLCKLANGSVRISPPYFHISHFA